MGIYTELLKERRGQAGEKHPEVSIELLIEPDVFSCDLGRTTKSNFQIAETEKKNCLIY